MPATYDIERDETNKESFVRFIEKHVNFVSAVLLVDLIVQNDYSRDYTWSILSTIFPKTLVNNIASVVTNAQSSLVRVHYQENIPEALKSSPVFFLDNPMVRQLTFTGPNMKKIVKDREQGALEILVELFNWMDGLEPQPVTEITSFNEIYQNIEAKTSDILDQRAREVEIDRLTNALRRDSAVSHPLCSHLAFEFYTRWM